MIFVCVVFFTVRVRACASLCKRARFIEFSQNESSADNFAQGTQRGI